MNKSKIKDKEKKLKISKKDGITLVALIVTIIVLLILAGLVISLTIGADGVINKAQMASVETERAEIQEALELALGELRIKSQEEKREIIEYCETKESFVQNSKFNTQIYNITDYELNTQEAIIVMKVRKKSEHLYEINLVTGEIKKAEIVQTQGNINYVLNGGNFTEEQVTTYTFGEIKGLSVPEKAGFFFDGWYQESDFSGEKLYRTTSQMNTDITVYAKWLAETNTDYFKYTTTQTAATIIGFSDIGKTAYDNGEITNLVLPRTYNNLPITTIGSSAFANCVKLEKVVIHDNATIQYTDVFLNCTGITELVMPISITRGFNGCTGLTQIIITKGNANGVGVNYSTGTTGTRYIYTPWYISKANEIEVKFEEGITQIGNNMFYACTGLKKIELPSTLTTIGGGAFQGCTGLMMQMEKFPKSVTTIGGSAFQGCIGLKGTLEVPTGILSIGGAFQGCTNIEKVIIPDSIGVTLDSAFNNCTGIQELVIPISISGVSGFRGCTGLKRITFTKGNADGVGVDYTTASVGSNRYLYTPWYESRANEITVKFAEGVTQIGTSMFYGCTGLTSIELPNTLTTINVGAFQGCTGLTMKIEKFPENITTIAGNAFNGCTGLIMQMENFPKSVTTIGGGAFQGCTGLKGTLELPTGIVSIGGAFQGCTNIEKVIIPDSIGVTLDSTFNNCTGIQELVIPISISGVSGFRGCTGLKRITFTKGNADGVGVDYTTASVGSNRYLYTPWYESRANEITVKFAEGVTQIGTSMFYGCTGLTSIELPNTLTTINVGAFQGCTGLTMKIEKFPENITTIAGNAFNGCTGLIMQMENFPKSVTTIGGGAFQGCTGLKGTLELPTGIVSIGGAFQGCTNIEKVIIPDSIGVTLDSTFNNCTGIQELVIPISISGVSGFRGCTGLKRITFTKGNADGVGVDYTTASVGSNRYLYTPWYESRANEITVKFAEGVTQIGTSMFYGCTGLTRVELPSTLTSINSGAFNGTTNAAFYYNGTSTDWTNNVTISSSNDQLSNINYLK